MTSTIPWGELVERGMCDKDEVELFSQVLKRFSPNTWSFSGYHNLTMVQRESVDKIVLFLNPPKS